MNKPTIFFDGRNKPTKQRPPPATRKTKHGALIFMHRSDGHNLTGGEIETNRLIFSKNVLKSILLNFLSYVVSVLNTAQLCCVKPE